MEDNDFERDDRNAAEHFEKHGVLFAIARAVFDDPDLIDDEDTSERYADVRYITIGMAYGRLLFVVHTPVEHRTRIISAREAEPHERRRYHEGKSDDFR